MVGVTRPIFAAFLVLFAVALGCAQPSPVASGRKDGDLRVATYNVAWFSARASDARLANLRAVVAELGPDVLALQEVEDRAGVQKWLGEDWSVGMADVPEETQETALAVRKPLRLGKVELLFEDPALDEPFPGRRDVLRAEVIIPDGPTLTFYVLHTKSRRGGRLATDPRREEASVLLVDAVREDPAEHKIVLGDLNANPDDRSVNILEAGDASAQAGPIQADPPFLVNLTESFYRQDGVSIGLSRMFEGKPLDPVVAGAYAEEEKWRGKVYSFPQDVAVTQALFDQILVSPTLARFAGQARAFSSVEALQGRGTQVSFDESGTRVSETQGDRASDHLPVFVDFDLGGLGKANSTK